LLSPVYAGDNEVDVMLGHSLKPGATQVSVKLVPVAFSGPGVTSVDALAVVFGMAVFSGMVTNWRALTAGAVLIVPTTLARIVAQLTNVTGAKSATGSPPRSIIHSAED
jgi:hypothetical protein